MLARLGASCVQRHGVQSYSTPSAVIELWNGLLRSGGGQAAESHAQVQGQWEAAEAVVKDQLRAFQGRVDGTLLPEQVHRNLMSFYRQLAPQDRTPFLLLLATRLGVQESEISSAVAHWQQVSARAAQAPPQRSTPGKPAPGTADVAGNTSAKAEAVMRAAERLRSACQPLYTQLLGPVSREPDGIPFLVTLRGHTRDALAAQPAFGASLRALDSTIKQALHGWFTPGLLQLRQLTWHNTPAHLLDKLIEYEAVHPIKGWQDLRTRLGPDRRVHAYFHPCLPEEPLVILHAALMHHIPSCMDQVLSPDHQQSSTGDLTGHHSLEPPISHATRHSSQTGLATGTSTTPSSSSATIAATAASTASSSSSAAAAATTAAAAGAGGGGGIVQDPSVAVFYSISSTQPGLSGVDLGHFLISDVARKVQAENSSIKRLVTLSPVPGFRNWLFSKLATLALEPPPPPPPQQQQQPQPQQQTYPGAHHPSHSSPTGHHDAQSSQHDNPAPQLSGIKPGNVQLPPLIRPDEAQQFLTAAPQLLSRSDLDKLAAAGNSPPACLALLLEAGASTRGPLVGMLQRLLLRCAARYLVLERRRSLALDPVAHFHLRNGAALCRINAMSDVGPEGHQRSLGIMANYEYVLDNTCSHNRLYLVDHEIQVSDSVKQLLRY